MSAKKTTKKKTAGDLSNLRQEAERKKNMKIARQTIGPAPSQEPAKKGSTDEQQSDGSASAFKNK